MFECPDFAASCTLLEHVLLSRRTLCVCLVSEARCNPLCSSPFLHRAHRRFVPTGTVIPSDKVIFCWSELSTTSARTFRDYPSYLCSSASSFTELTQFSFLYLLLVGVVTGPLNVNTPFCTTITSLSISDTIMGVTTPSYWLNTYHPS